MDGDDIDNIDRAIIACLYKNARGAKVEEMAKEAGVTHSTISKRIKRLEEQGIISTYLVEVDYEAAGYPFKMVFTCTAPISKRDAYIREAMSLPNVVEIREMMVGRENVHITVVGEEKDDITTVAKAIDEIGFTVEGEILVRETRHKLPRTLVNHRD